MNNEITRRGFACWLGSARAVSAVDGAITAAQVVERIKKKLAEEGVVWRPSNFDGFHLGDPETRVTGIATAFQPTFSVLRRAAAAGKNFVVCHESTYWDGSIRWW
jgi:putative NIF3 family GTP cyclohydrolase 1 type 2